MIKKRQNRSKCVEGLDNGCQQSELGGSTRKRAVGVKSECFGSEMEFAVVGEQ